MVSAAAEAVEAKPASKVNGKGKAAEAKSSAGRGGKKPAAASRAGGRGGSDRPGTRAADSSPASNGATMASSTIEDKGRLQALERALGHCPTHRQ